MVRKNGNVKGRGWFGHPYRHALSSKGIINASEGEYVYVGGRDSPRFRSFTRGGRTDVSNAFHTTTDPNVAQSFAEEDGKVYKLHIDTSEVPEERILRKEDWTEPMMNDFVKSGMIYFKHLKETRPELVESLQNRGYNRYVSVEMLSTDKPLDIFAYPTEYGLNEDEVAIFDRELLLNAWENKRILTDEEIRKADYEYHKKRMKQIEEMSG